MSERGLVSVVRRALGRCRRRGAFGTRSGLTLIEVAVSSALLALIGAGLISCALAGVRMSEYLRITTEARALAKARMEELRALGCASLAQNPTAAPLLGATNAVTLGHPVIRRTSVYWHTATGGLGTAASNDYAEVVVDVEYYEPFRRRTVTDKYTGIVR